MPANASRIVAFMLVAGLLSGCSTVSGIGSTTRTSSISQPMAAAPVRMQTPAAPPPSMKGMDFTQAVAALASTPGTGVTSVGRPSTALALVEEPRAPSKAKPKPRKSTPAKATVAVVVPETRPAADAGAAWVGPKVDPCLVVPPDPACPAIAPALPIVRRF